MMSVLKRFEDFMWGTKNNTDARNRTETNGQTDGEVFMKAWESNVIEYNRSAGYDRIKSSSSSKTQSVSKSQSIVNINIICRSKNFTVSLYRSEDEYLLGLNDLLDTSNHREIHTRVNKITPENISLYISQCFWTIWGWTYVIPRFIECWKFVVDERKDNRMSILKNKAEDPPAHWFELHYEYTCSVSFPIRKHEWDVKIIYNGYTLIFYFIDPGTKSSIRDYTIRAPFSDDDYKSIIDFAISCIIDISR
jgi:hypothetical protein